MDEEKKDIDPNKQVPQIKLDGKGTAWDLKVVGAYIAYGVLTSGVAFVFGNLIEKRCVKRVNYALWNDWFQRQDKKDDEA